MDQLHPFLYTEELTLISKRERSRTPKVVLCIPWKNVILCDAAIQPELFGFEIWLKTICRITFEISDVKSVLRKLIYTS